MSFSETTLERGAGRDEARTLFGQVMGLVAVTAGLFAVGAYLGRDLSYGWGWVLFIASFACLMGMSFAVKQSEQLAVGLLFGFGVLIGLATAPTIAYYARRIRRPSGRRAGRPRSSSPASEPPGMPPAATSRLSRAFSSGPCSR